MKKLGATSQMRELFGRIARTGENDVVRLGERAIPPSGDAPYAAWHAWSVDAPKSFWSALWNFAGVIADADANGVAWRDVLRGGDRMAPPDPQVGPVWFDGARLNLAENLLRRRDDAAALVFRGEDGAKRRVSFAELHQRAGDAAAALLAAGVRPGDRIAGFLPNIPEAVIAMLGAAWIGAVWSSCSPDFGAEGVVNRFGQIAPTVLIAADGYRYAGKEIDCLERIAVIEARLPTVELVVVVPFLRPAPDVGRIAHAIVWNTWLASGGRNPPPFARLAFAAPLFVMYSSGTTGLPKCIVHGAGGTLLQHMKEHVLHGDLRAGEVIFYFTTCGWMMWNWVVSALAVGATVVLYDGAALGTRPAVLWDIVAEERVGVFGASATFLALCEKAGVVPVRTHDLSRLRMILSTGSPLAAESFDYVDRDVKPGVHLASISGGTDIISCFALGNPLLPVRRGELQARGLGMAVEVFAEDGTPLRGVPGELVCTRPFPSMPVAFWNDPDGSRYRSAYFGVFPGVWTHGDWAEITPEGGVIIYGRSDTTLNPGGVRIGTAEICRVVDQMEEVVDSVVIEQTMQPGRSPRPANRVVLFVHLNEGALLNDELRARIARRIRTAASPRHVPDLILHVSGIPRTRSGKIVELAVRDAFSGREVKNLSSVANPAALAEYRALGEQHRP